MQAIHSISEITAIEPQVNAILQDARNTGTPDWSDYSCFKDRLFRFVGFGASKKELQTCAAYEIAITALCDALKL